MNVKAYMEEVAKEMRKVSWPSRKELISNTIVTIGATLAISLFIFPLLGLVVFFQLRYIRKE